MRRSLYGLLVLLALLGGLARLAPPTQAAPPPARWPLGICGGSWQIGDPPPPPNGGQLYAIAGASAADLWAVGDGPGANSGTTIPILYRWQGAGWNRYLGLNGPSSFTSLHGVALPPGAPNTGWAVGYQNTPYQPLAAQWNGSAWTLVSLPTTPAWSQLSGVAYNPTNSHQAWAVGWTGQGLQTSTPLVFFAQDSTWQTVALPAFNGGLRAVAVVSSSNIWAVGWSGATNPIQPLILHWDGSAWTASPVPPGLDGSGLRALKVLAPNNIYAVGGGGPPTLLHWDGGTWTVLAVPGPPDIREFFGVDAAAPDDVWAVGAVAPIGLSPYTFSVHYDGYSWRVYPPQNEGNAGDHLYGLLMPTGTNRVWAVGSAATLLQGNTSWAPQVQSFDCALQTATPTATNTPTNTPTATFTNTPTNTPTDTPTHTPTNTPTNTPSNTPTRTPTDTPTDTPTNTPTPTPSETAIPRAPCAVVNDILYPAPDGGPINGGWPLELAAPAPTLVVVAANQLAYSNIYQYAQVLTGTATLQVVVQLCQPDSVTYAVAVTDPDGSNPQAWGRVTHSYPGSCTPEADSVSFPVPAQSLVLKRVQLQITHLTPAQLSLQIGPSTQLVLPAWQQGPCNATATPYPTFTPPPTATITPTPTHCALSFADVPPDQPFYVYIRCLVCHGIVSGYSSAPPCADGQVPCFLPGNPVTRGQLSKILANAAGLTAAIPPTQQTFADVPSGNPFWIYIERLAGQGAISGYTGDGRTVNPCTQQVEAAGRLYFRWCNPSTRGQIAKITANAAGFTDVVPSTQQTFEDVLYGSPFWLYIERIAERNVINGYDCGQGVNEPCVPPLMRNYFRPGLNTTRGQMSKIASITFFPGCNPPLRPGG